MKMKKTKVLVVHNQAAPYRLPLFEELSKYYDLEVFFCEGVSSDRKWDSDVNDFSFKGDILFTIKVGILLISLDILKKLLKKRHDIYVVMDHPSMFFTSTITIIVAKLFRKPIIVWTGQNKNTYRMEKLKKSETALTKLSYSIKEYYQKCIYIFSDAFLAYCEKTREHLIEKGVKEDRIFVGGQIMPYELLCDSGEAKNDCGDKKIILTVSYLREGKGIQYLIDAYKTMNRKDTVLIIAGEGECKDELERMVGSRSDIVFTGYIKGKEKARYYKMADIFVLPTLYDAWGLVVNEAMYYGLPVIITESAGASEVVNRVGNGMVIRSRDVKQLRDALNLLLDDDELRLKMSKKSLAYKHKYTDKKEGIKIFRKVISYATK